MSLVTIMCNIEYLSLLLGQVNKIRVLVSFYLIYLLVIFSLFGTSASYFLRFLYFYLVKRRIEIQYIWYAGGCALSVVVISVIGQWFLTK